MKQGQQFFFGPFWLDPINERLWREGQEVVLRPRPFAMLRYLVEHCGRLVTQEELLKAVWAGMYVAPTTPRVCLHDIREALGEDVTAPRFIETVARRGYRFIAPVTTTASPAENLKVGKSKSTESAIVGREAELEQLHGWLTKALDGERQMVFVTGEPGIGKTTLVDAFLAQVEASRQVPSSKSKVQSLQSAIALVARGQCIEHYSASEAYLPVLEAFGRLCREPEGEQLLAVLSQRAPMWLLQMPSLLSAVELEGVQRRSVGATPERMLREMAEAIEELTTRQPLVLWLEDLHGSDYATLDLLAFLARRRELARLLVIGTYRPLAVRTGEHPLYAIQQELQVRGQCHELALEPLGEGAVAQYLETRIAGGTTPASSLHDLAHVIHQRTEGNSLFMVSVVDTVLQQKELGHNIDAVSHTMPVNIRQFIEQQIAHLRSEDRQLLEVISVGGMECAAAAISAGLGERTEEVEERCAEVARRGHFVRASESEEWPDGTLTARYRFVHALYQEVLYERVTVARRVSLHQRIGERVERGYGARAGEMAAELAMHFERGRDYRRAVQYLGQAAETSLRRYAYREAISHLTTGLELLQTLPETLEHRQQELALHIVLGPMLSITKGWGNPEVEQVYTRARELCQQMGDTPQLFPVLQGLWFFSLVRAEHQTAHELGEQLLRLAQSVQDPALLLEAHHALGIILYFLGELAVAQEHVEQGTALYDPAQHYSFALLYANDPGVMCLTIAALVLWLRGYPDQARARAEEALALAHTLSHPLSLGVGLFGCAIVSQHRLRQEPTRLPGHGQAAPQWTEEVLALSTTQGFPLMLAVGLILQGAVLARQGQSEAGIEQMRQGLAAFAATGAESMRTYFLALLAEAYSTVGQPEKGLAVLEEALGAVDTTGERLYEAELWRLKGGLTLEQSRVQSLESRVENQKSEGRKLKVTNSRPLTPDPQAEAEAEACFHKAIDIARHQGAKSLELRAAMSLSRLWLQQGKKKQARQMLTKIYGWFTEGFDTADLQEAKVLLAAL